MTEYEIMKKDGIQNRIYTIRGVHVMLDRDLAYFYGIENRALKQAVKRNPARFPDDFLFVLNDGEIDLLVSQNVIPSKNIWVVHDLLLLPSKGWQVFRVCCKVKKQ